MSGGTLASAAASATLSIHAASLDLGSLGGTGRSLLCVGTAYRLVGCDARRRSCVGNALDQAAALGSLSGTGRSVLGVCTADRPVGVTLAAAAASATLSIKAAALAPGSLGGTGLSLFGVCTADCPFGCDARHRSCVSERSQSTLLLSLSEAWAAQAARCSAAAPLIALSCATLAAATASATLSINAVALPLGSLSCIGLSLLDMCTADHCVGCDARLRSCVGNALDQRCLSRSRKLGRHRPLAARRLHR